MSSPLRPLRRWIAALAVAAVAVLPAAQAAQPTALDAYLQGLNTWSADFTSDTRDEQDQQLETGNGRLVIVRPGRFRWESRFEDTDELVQVAIADGRNLWIYEPDLESATVKPVAEVLPQSPAMLLAGGADLREAFVVAADGRRNGMDWVRVEPKVAESDFEQALFGFRGRELARLVVIDKLGQRSTLVFSRVRRNAAVDPKLVEFKPPAELDVIGTPVAP